LWIISSHFKSRQSLNFPPEPSYFLVLSENHSLLHPLVVSGFSKNSYFFSLENDVSLSVTSCSSFNFRRPPVLYNCETTVIVPTFPSFATSAVLRKRCVLILSCVDSCFVVVLPTLTHTNTLFVFTKFLLCGTRYLSSLGGDAPGALGAAVDELLRHQPTLKDDGLESVSAMVESLLAFDERADSIEIVTGQDHLLRRREKKDKKGQDDAAAAAAADAGNPSTTSAVASAAVSPSSEGSAIGGVGGAGPTGIVVGISLDDESVADGDAVMASASADPQASAAAGAGASSAAGVCIRAARVGHASVHLTHAPTHIRHPR
jgi:hypothetical protein